MRPDQRGLSLLEYLALLIVLVGVVIWLYPRWVADQQAGYREMAQTALYGLAEALQAHHERTGTYGGAAGAQGEPADTGAPWMFPDEVPGNGAVIRYRLRIALANPRGFEIRAVPALDQTADPCGTLTLTANGTRGMLNAEPDLRRADCWP